MKNFRKRKWRFRLQFDRLLYILLIKSKSGHEESCIQDVLNTLVHRIVRGSTLPDCPSSGFRSSRFRRTEKTDASCGKGCHPLAEEPVHVLLISFCRDAHEDTREMRKTLCPLAQDAPTSLSMEYPSLSWGENLKKKFPSSVPWYREREQLKTFEKIRQHIKKEEEESLLLLLTRKQLKLSTI